MTRKECLEQAMGCVLKDRNREYGGPEDSFGVIANFWSVYLGKKVYPHDVAMMMALLKIARIKGNRGYKDGYIDLAGYAACGAECASGSPVSAPKAEDEPEFKPGDKVQVYFPSIAEWRDATYVSFCQMARNVWRHEVEFSDGGRRYLLREHVRIAPKAEGCEELVQKDLADECGGCLYRLASDAPRTPEETCQRIVDSNPSIYPRTPTGEELAEMAEEDAHDE